MYSLFLKKCRILAVSCCCGSGRILLILPDPDPYKSTDPESASVIVFGNLKYKKSEWFDFSSSVVSNPGQESGSIKRTTWAILLKSYGYLLRNPQLLCLYFTGLVLVLLAFYGSQLFNTICQLLTLVATTFVLSIQILFSLKAKPSLKMCKHLNKGSNIPWYCPVM